MTAVVNSTVCPRSRFDFHCFHWSYCQDACVSSLGCAVLLHVVDPGARQYVWNPGRCHHPNLWPQNCAMEKGVCDWYVKFAIVDMLTLSLPRVINFNFLFHSLIRNISYTMENLAVSHFSLHHPIIFFSNGWENLHYEPCFSVQIKHTNCTGMNSVHQQCEHHH